MIKSGLLEIIEYFGSWFFVGYSYQEIRKQHKGENFIIKKGLF